MKKKTKWIIGLVTLLIILVIGDYYLFTLKKNNNNTDNTDTPKVCNNSTVTGIILDASMHNIMIQYNDSEYTFYYDEPDMSQATSMFIGNNATIYYDGCLSETDEVQNVTVKKITTENTQNIVPDTPQTVLTDQGLFSEYYDEAYTKLKTMTLDEKIGQLFLVRVPASDAVSVVKTNQFGGYILFGRDTSGKTKEELISTIQSYQSVSKIPLIIATDEEGGSVVRVSSNTNLSSHKFASPQEIYQSGGFDAIKNDNIEKNQLLSSLGINVNLAPVSDVSTNPSDFIYDRSFGKDAVSTSTFVQTIINSSQNSNVSNVLKHFPGYGNNVDTHTGIAIDNRSLETFETSDLLPFEAGINEYAEAILVSHNIIVNMENNMPASLSPKVHNILRNELNFTGIIMTDDLAMDAIKDYTSNPSIKALKSGNDMMIITDYAQGISDIKSALNSGDITENIIDKSVMRILAWKYYKKLL